MKTRHLLLAILLASSPLAGADCGYSTDDADSPAFASKITECEGEEQAPDSGNAEQKKGARTIKLYGDGTVDPATGIAERPVVAPGTLNHNPGNTYAAREPYSLRPGAKFEESVTFAIHRLHTQMAHYCSGGWHKQEEWSTPVPGAEGGFFLHYQFKCME